MVVEASHMFDYNTKFDSDNISFVIYRAPKRSMKTVKI